MINAVADEARDLFANALERAGPAYRNTADSIRAGSYGNFWTVAALMAIETALRTGPSDETEIAAR